MPSFFVCRACLLSQRVERNTTAEPIGREAEGKCVVGDDRV
jgi:hypothetical protein